MKEQALKYYALARNTQKLNELAVMTRDHPYFNVSSPYLRRRVIQILREQKSDSDDLMQKVGVFVLFVAILGLLFLMVNDLQ